MRNALAITTFLLVQMACAQPAIVHLNAPSYPDQVAILYRYDDLFSLRTVRMSDAVIGIDGSATLEATVQGTTKLRLRIGDATADLFARPGSTYRLTFPLPDPRSPRSINGTLRVDPEFADLDPMDVNALTTDLNERVDAFISEDLATDQVAGMQALEVQRKGEAQPPDSAARPATLFVMPTWSKLRVDSFELKVRRFYREVNDPWFARFMDHSFAGLRHGPQVNEQELFDRYLLNAPVQYDDPEYVRFVRSFYSEHLALLKRFHEDALNRAYAGGSTDSLKALLSAHPHLKENDRLCELVMMDLLYQYYQTKLVDKHGAERILTYLAGGSSYLEHRTIAANMLWDLTAMRVGNKLPALRMEDLRGKDVLLDSLLNGPVCIAVTAGWCSYCELELQGLEQLHKTYGTVVPIIAISLDTDPETTRKFVKAHPGMDFRWLRAVGEQQLRDEWRLRSLPAFFLLNDGQLARSPAPAPSQGLGALFLQAKAAAEAGSKLKVWDD